MSAQEGQKLLEAAKGADFPAFAKLLTWIERAKISDVLQIEELFNPTRQAFRIGITGPPGAGKSTLVGALLKSLRIKKLRVGVIAVDPSSPFTRGAILGDRIRYSEHVLDEQVFIRSLGTRGSLGGLSSAAFLMARAFDVCGFDVLLIETVGVGQTELDVLHVADQVCVVLVPESGDSIQAMKAGLMEIADIFVVNKSDRLGADGLAREIENSIHDGESAKKVKVLKTTASEHLGVDALSVEFEMLRKSGEWKKARANSRRFREEAKALLRREWEHTIDATLAKISDLERLRKILK
jgi:LAO/AO transport system kinase